MPPANYLRQQWRHNSSTFLWVRVNGTEIIFKPTDALEHNCISSCTRAKPQLLDRGYIKSNPMGFFQ